MRALRGMSLAVLFAAAAESMASSPDVSNATVVRQGPLVSAYVKARQADPLYRGALADRESNLIGARVAGVAYYPQMNVSSSQLENEGGASRRSISLIQPVFSVDRYATMKEEEPRRVIAEASFQLQAGDLAKRLYLATANLIRAREGHELNLVRIKTVEQHKRAAQRGYELGQGTITDLRDAEVKVLQAAAEDHKLRAGMSAAERDFASIVGEAPPIFRLANLRRSEALPAAALDAVGKNSPALVVAHEQERIGELAVIKARSAWLPNINASYTATDLNGKKDTIVGISLTMPIQAGGVMGTATASSRLAKLREDAIDAERKLKLETQRLNDLVQAGLAEVETRRAAIEAAQLSVEANEKSFKGGVRSMVDLLNSIETVYRLKNEYIQTILALGETLLNLRLQEGVDPLDSLHEVDALILN